MTMRKAVKIALAALGLFIYFNIGYLMAYSFDPTVQPTVASDTFYHIADFTGSIGKGAEASYSNHVIGIILYVMLTIIWPLMLVFFWIFNLAIFFWWVLVWIFTGGFLRWLGLLN